MKSKLYDKIFTIIHKSDKNCKLFFKLKENEQKQLGT